MVFIKSYLHIRCSTFISIKSLSTNIICLCMGECWPNSTTAYLTYTFLGYERKDSIDRYYTHEQMTKQPLPELLIQPCKYTSNCKPMPCFCKKMHIDYVSLCKCIKKIVKVKKINYYKFFMSPIFFFINNSFFFCSFFTWLAVSMFNHKKTKYCH